MATNADAYSGSPAEKLAGRQINTVFGHRVTAIDPDAATVALDDGTALAADTVLIATGGRARTLPIPGADLQGVHVLRTFADAIGIPIFQFPAANISLKNRVTGVHPAIMAPTMFYSYWTWKQPSAE